MELDWLEQVLPRLRCPDSHQPLRWAVEDEVRRAALPHGSRALASADGRHVYPIRDGIPILLPADPGAKNDG